MRPSNIPKDSESSGSANVSTAYETEISTDYKSWSGARLITKAQVCELLGNIAPQTLWDLQNRHDFPRAIVLSADPNGTSGRSYFIASEVQAWLQGRPRRVLKTDRSTGGGQ